jgi:hypothetical protein
LGFVAGGGGAACAASAAGIENPINTLNSTIDIAEWCGLRIMPPLLNIETDSILESVHEKQLQDSSNLRAQIGPKVLPGTWL